MRAEANDEFIINIIKLSRKIVGIKMTGNMIVNFTQRE
jgi:hypothetical protein